MSWGSPEEVERRRRILLAVWAYAYETLDHSLVSDETFDREAKLVDVSIATGNRKLDNFYKKHFADYTGQWVLKHPERVKLDRLARAAIKRQSENEN